MPINESSAVDAGQALAAADNVRTRARKLQHTPWWLNGLILLGMVGTAFLRPPVGPWAQLAAALVLTAIAMWRLRRGKYRPRYFDNSLSLITLVSVNSLTLGYALPAVMDHGFTAPAGPADDAFSLLAAVVMTALGFGIAILLTRLALWRVR